MSEQPPPRVGMTPWWELTTHAEFLRCVNLAAGELVQLSNRREDVQDTREAGLVVRQAFLVAMLSLSRDFIQSVPQEVGLRFLSAAREYMEGVEALAKAASEKRIILVGGPTEKQ